VSLIPPDGDGLLTLTVASLDRAWNVSSTTTYAIDLKPTAPTIKQLTANPQFDQPAEFLLQPDPGLQAASPVVSYTVQFTDQSEHTMTVKASAHGTARLRLTLDGISGDVLSVTSTSADGWVSGNSFWSYAIDTSPTVSSDVYAENQTSGGVGVAGTFTFTPKVKNVVSYTYSFNGGSDVTVRAGAKGVARISWTPDDSGFYDLEVYATTRNGLELASYDYFFNVN
jgi:hypothetical protein